MNSNRILGIFISFTLLVWIFIFALSPQLKYQQSSNIKIPKLPEPLVNQDSFKKIEFKEANNDILEVDTKDTLPSAKERVDSFDLNLYVYKVGAFKSPITIANLVKKFDDAGFPSQTKTNQSDQNLTNVLVGPFASKKDITDNQEIFNKIAETEVGEVLAWNP